MEVQKEQKNVKTLINTNWGPVFYVGTLGIYIHTYVYINILKNL